MKIEVYIMARNESRMIPYLMRHYGQFARVIFLEGNSTDNTIELATSLGAEVWHYDMPDELDDERHIKIKNECWLGSTADWVMVVDADEFVYHPDLVNRLSTINSTIIVPSFHNMFSDVFPTTDGQIYDEVKYGTADGGIWRSKPVIFKPGQIQSMNWHPGGHVASPVGNVVYWCESGIKLLHMRFLSREWVYEHYYKNSHRMSKTNLANDFAGQYFWDHKIIEKIFTETKLIKIV